MLVYWFCYLQNIGLGWKMLRINNHAFEFLQCLHGKLGINVHKYVQNGCAYINEYESSQIL